MLLRSTLIYAPAVLFTRIAALLLLVIATRLVDKTEYGLLTLVVSVGELVDVALANWLRIAFVRLGGTGDLTRGSVALAARVLVVTTALAVLASLAASSFIVPEDWLGFSIAVGAYLVAGAVGRFALSVLQMQRRQRLYALLEFLRAALQLALPVAVMLLLPSSFVAVSLASSLGALIAGLVALGIAVRPLLPGPSRFRWQELIGFGLPLIVLALVGFGLNNAERVALKIYYDAGAVAVFAAAYALARQPIDMLANAVNMGAFPEAVSRFDTEGPAAAGALLSQMMGLMLSLTLPMAALMVALGPDITALVLPPDYATGASALFPVIATAVILANLKAFVFDNVVHAFKRPWLLIISVAPGSVVTIGLSLLLIPQLAATGAALALALGTAVSLIASIVVSHRLLPIRMPWRDIALAVGIALATGLAAWLGSTSLGHASAFWRLAVGGSAGSLVFLALNALARPEDTRRIALGLVRRGKAA